MRHLWIALCVLLIAAGVSAQEGNTTYTVREGETVEGIAQRLNVAPDCLIAANRLGAVVQLTPGRVLIVPLSCPAFDSPATPEAAATGEADAEPVEDGAGGGAVAATPVPEDFVEPADNQIYVVQRGDQLRRIAARYGVSLTCLARANNIANPDLIFVGQELLISSTCQGSGGGVIGMPGERRACFGDRNAGRVISGGTYTIRAGDTLDFVACDLGIALSCLANANPQLGNIGRIQPGTVISIPSGCPPWDGPPGPGDLGQ
jgi:LysM repeat protein